MEDLEDAEETMSLYEESIKRFAEIITQKDNIQRSTLEDRLLPALELLLEHQTKRRPLLLKIITFGIVRNKTNKFLQAEIENLRKELKEWRPTT